MELIKINIIEAKKRIQAGKRVIACPSKLNPYFGTDKNNRLDMFCVEVSKENWPSDKSFEENFATWRNNYLFYNSDACKGTTIHFYYC